MQEIKQPTRKLRGQSNDCSIPNETLLGSNDGISWGEAIEKNLIEPGMTVVFGNPKFENIELSFEESGKEQIVNGFLDKGIVIRDSAGNYQIAVCICFENEVQLRGRYGTINARHVFDKILKKVLYFCQNYMISWKGSKFEEFLAYSKYFLQYVLSYANGNDLPCYFITDSNKVYQFSTCDKDNCDYAYLNFTLGTSFELNVEKMVIPFNLASDAKFELKKCTCKFSDENDTFNKNSFKNYIYIR